MSVSQSPLLRSAGAPLVCVELFAWSNLAFLALDVYIAHSTNSFDLDAEWIPVVFSLGGPIVLLAAIFLQWRICPATADNATTLRLRLARGLGLMVGFGAVVVGIAGLLWHLNSQFFTAATLKSLVYTAPFVAPLAYTGVGFLLLLDRLTPSDADEWGTWVVLLALGGFIGNFILSLADHAQNGFFVWYEWIPVAAAAIAVGNLISVAFVDRSAEALKLSAAIMLLQAAVGILGWYFHARAILASRMESLWDKVVYSAPVFAPLLFVNLAILATIGLWAIWQHLPEPNA